MSSPADKPGLTLASLAAMVLGLLVTSIFVQYFEVVVMIAFPAEYTLALPAIWAFLGIAGFCSIGYLSTRVRWLSKAEMLCVLFVMLMAAPLMTQAFWHRIVSVVGTNPRQGDLDKLAAMNDGLWPHGPDVLVDRLASGAAGSEFAGPGALTWEDFNLGAGRTARGAAIKNTDAGESYIRMKLPIIAEGESGGVTPGSPCLVNVLFRATNLSPDSAVFLRIGGEGAAAVTEIARSSEGPKKTFQDPEGFRRFGAYNVKFPVDARQFCWVDVGLSGAGRLEIAGANLMDVSTLEGVFRGRREVTRAQWESMPEYERVGLIVRPESMWSWEGVKYVAAGYIPWRDWWRPLFVWSCFVLLVLGACLCVNLIFRKQWIDHERNLLPVAQIPAALAGVQLNSDAADERPWYRSPMAWAGFAIGMIWLLMRAWQFYDPRVPNLTVRIDFKDWLTHPNWGTTWANVHLTAHPCLIALCGFMELSMLISLVIGFFAYRSQGAVGAQMGWNSIPNYPFEPQQQLASFLAYACGILWIARRHLVRVGRAVIFGPEPADADEPVSYRWSVGILILCMIGGVAWAWWLGMSVQGFVVFFGLLIAIGLVASKVRAEFGTPWGYLAPSNFAMLLLLLGGVSVFGPEAVLFCYIASFMLSPTVFYLIPGAQLEFLELGRRAGVRNWHLPAVCVLAVIGGMFFGGWTFLSNSYAMGGETFRYSWAYDAKAWYFFTYNQEMARATAEMTAQTTAQAATHTGADASWFTPERWAYLYSSTVTFVLVGLRQFWRGFWVHPAGFVLGMTGMAAYTWGSALAAWVIRGSVVYFGGAVAVRRHLTPFLIGLFVGGALAELLIGVDAAFRRAAGNESAFGSIFPP